jgi:RimJ/RimL family protein N-acetyltransferase
VNTRALHLYERLGYEQVGVLRAFVIAEHDELLLRKTRGSWTEFRRRRDEPGHEAAEKF